MPDLTTVTSQKPSRRPALPTGVSFWAVAGITFLALAANTAASPLYRVYQARFGFSATVLTLLFTVYVVAVLVTLLFLGSASDYVGRRAVMLAGLAAVASGLFLVAHALWVLFAARALQGAAMGLISGAASAAQLDLRPDSRVTPLVSSTAPSAGLAIGALGGSALAQYAPAPTRLIWWLLGGGFIIGIAIVLAMPEPGTPRPGMVSSLRPHAGVPPEARREFAAAVPCLVAVWALGGFYLALGPSLAAQLLRGVRETLGIPGCSRPPV
jgi:MFS family permease